MRRIIPTLVFCIAVGACGLQASIEPAPVALPAPAPTSAPASTLTTAAATREPPANEELSTDTLPDGASLVFTASEAIDVYPTPESAGPTMTLEPTTILGTPTVLVVLEGPVDGWGRAMIPVRPNGSEGWVEVEETMLSIVDSHVVVDLSERTLSYYDSGDVVLTTTVAVGSAGNPTPVGTFFVTDNVTLADPNSPWGPHALGLSARSDTITEYNGGDGIIGIHGTNRPASIGKAASLGCIRVPNEVITRLHEMVPLGTPVEIRA